MIIAWLITICTFVVAGEIDVTVKVPVAVAENTTVKMTCDYDLKKNELYSIKWYKSKKEFYRYIPKEMPPKMAFEPFRTKVDVSLNKVRSE